LDDDRGFVVTRGHVDVFLVDTSPAGGGRRHPLLRVSAGETLAGLNGAFDGQPASLLAVGTGATELREDPTADRTAWRTRLAEAVGGRVDEENPELAPADGPRFDRALAQRLVRQLEARRDAEADQLAARDDRHRGVLGSALHGLAAVVETQGSPSLPPAPVSTDAENGSGLRAACQLVAESQGLSLDTAVLSPQEHESASDGGPDEPTGFDERVTDLARAADLRVRRVALKGDWWTRDNGPLLAQTESSAPAPTSGADAGATGGRAVALLPDRPGRYVVVDPQTGERERVDAEEAERLHPFAYSLYRPFPAGALSWSDVLWFGLRRRRRDLLLVVLVSAAASLLSTATPVVTGIIIDDVIPSADRGRLMEWTAILLVGAVVAACFQITRSFALLRLQGRVEADVQSAVWDRLLSLPLSFFRRFTAGEVAQRAMSVSHIQRLLAGPVLTSLLGGVFSVFHFGLLFFYSPSLALWAVGLSAVAFLVMTGGTLLQLRLQRPITDLGNRLSGLVLQLLTGIAKLRAAGAEAAAFTRWAALFGEKRRLQFRQRRVAVVVGMGLRVAPLLITLAIFAVVASDLRAGASIPTGDLLAFLAALTAGLSALLSMRTAITQVARAIPLYESARPILQAAPETDAGREAPGRLTGRVDVQHVSFRYEDDGPWVLKDVSLSVSAGAFIGLVGPSGSGKSTLLRLLLGFETPDNGAIRYDDRDLAGLDVRAVRRQIGVVLQNGALTPGDIRSNICGATRATTDEVWTAADRAGLADDIREMPMGLHTVVGAGASTLSGGQVQRLLIARAIVHEPRFLFFDEATSALDNRTQAQVSRSLDALDATRVVVAHRLSTIRHADCIYVLDAGRLVESGTFEDLRAAGGLFAELAARQTA